jgi:hypothetical protein
MDYQEEQAQELEILNSIYDEEEFEGKPPIRPPFNPQNYPLQNTEYESYPIPTNQILVYPLL